MFQLPFEGKTVRFLNDQLVVVAGNNPKGCIQILSTYNADSNSDDDVQFRNVGEIQFTSSRINDLEICNETCLAVSSLDFKTGGGTICLIDVNASETNILKHTKTLTNEIDSSAISSLTFDPHHEQLISATEYGNITVWDIKTEKNLISFKADDCGVNKVHYSKSGQIVSIGNSCKSQLRLWDIRTNTLGKTVDDYNSVLKPARSFKHPKSPLESSYIFYSSVCCDPFQPKIVCGTNTGSVIEWDYRSNSNSTSDDFRKQVPLNYYHNLHDNTITNLIYNCYNRNIIFSSSSDGTVKQFLNNNNKNNANFFSSNYSNDSNNALITSTPTECNTLIEDYGAINGLDIIESLGLLSAVSSIGGLWRYNLKQSVM